MNEKKVKKSLNRMLGNVQQIQVCLLLIIIILTLLLLKAQGIIK